MIIMIFTNYFYLESEGQEDEEHLNALAEEYNQENAETYSYLATGWEEDFETDEDEENYYYDCTCYWEEITEEEYSERD